MTHWYWFLAFIVAAFLVRKRTPRAPRRDEVVSPALRAAAAAHGWTWREQPDDADRPEALGRHALFTRVAWLATGTIDDVTWGFEACTIPDDHTERTLTRFRATLPDPLPFALHLTDRDSLAHTADMPGAGRARRGIGRELAEREPGSTVPYEELAELVLPALDRRVPAPVEVDAAGYAVLLTPTGAHRGERVMLGIGPAVVAWHAAHPAMPVTVHALTRHLEISVQSLLVDANEVEDLYRLALAVVAEARRER